MGEHHNTRGARLFARGITSDYTANGITGSQGTLCGSCRTQVFGTYTREHWQDQQTRRQRGLRPTWYTIDTQHGDLYSSAFLSDECFICAGSGRQLSFSLERNSHQTTGNRSLRPQFWLNFGSPEWTQERWGIFDMEDKPLLHTLGADSLRDIVDPYVEKVRQDPNKDEAFSDPGPHWKIKGVNQSTGSDAFLALAREWLRLCQGTHEECRQRHNGSANWYPTRLLSLRAESPSVVADGVSSTDYSTEAMNDQTIRQRVLLGQTDIHVRLIVTEEEVPQSTYATLSHCWGESSFETLTSSNFAELNQAGWPLARFLPSFRDAIITTLDLGLKYIWIDCYCILQGSDDASTWDWHQESLQMKNVYRHSHINLGATAAKGPQRGLTSPRQRTKNSQIVEWRPSVSEPRKDYRLVPMHESLFIWPQSKLFAETLFTRAWIIQERLLAPRMLHFGTSYMAWECAELEFASNLCPVGLDGEASGKFLGTCPGKLVSSQYQDSDDIYRQWSSILNLYTRSELSHPEKDKLLAIQGLGELIAERTNDAYHDGFLDTTLPKSLCWQVNVSRCQRAQDRRMPSWNWASMDGPLDFDPELHISNSGEQLCAKIGLTTPEELFETPQIILCIGRLLKASLSIEQPRGIGTRIRTAVIDFGGRQGTASFDDFDECRRCIDAGGTYFVLPIFASHQTARHKKPQHGFLFLARRESGTFRRLGTFNPYMQRGETIADLRKALMELYMKSQASLIMLE